MTPVARTPPNPLLLQCMHDYALAASRFRIRLRISSGFEHYCNVPRSGVNKNLGPPLEWAQNVSSNTYLLTGCFTCAYSDNEFNRAVVNPITPAALYVLCKELERAHLGDETTADYGAYTIDTTARLYSQWDSLVSRRQYQRRHQATRADEAASAVLGLLGLPDTGTATTSPIMYVNWAQLPEWFEKMLDNSWRVTYGGVGVREGSAHSLWCLKRNGLGADNIDSPAQLKITVHIESREDGDGTLDIASSKQVARRCLANIINSTAFLIESVWTRGDLSEFGEYSVQYTDGGGCIAVAASQTVVEICDNHTLTLETFNWRARKLLEYTAHWYP
ncbi:hypothetical protein EDD85DRAFT_790693 [Armillaria nabsnona]|nr:hypothetical protein EDD85DRAFT_790693 [Armillaria nabsnona]